MQKVLALYDIHFGFEKKYVGGKLIKSPTHNKKAIDLAMAFCEDFKPDVFILGGDQLNCGPVSHWLKGKPRLVEGFRLKVELDLLKNNVISKVKAPRKIWLKGNHCVWLDNWLEQNPGVDGLFSIEEYLDLYDNNWEIYDQGEIAKVGKIYFVHGDTVLGKGGYVNAALRLVQVYRRNIRAGHLHRFDVATDLSPYDKKDYHTEMIIPCLANINPSYLKNNPNKFINGFYIAEIQDNGNFNDQVIVINNNSFIYNGKEYK